MVGELLNQEYNNFSNNGKNRFPKITLSGTYFHLKANYTETPLSDGTDHASFKVKSNVDIIIVDDITFTDTPSDGISSQASSDQSTSITSPVVTPTISYQGVSYTPETFSVNLSSSYLSQLSDIDAL